MEKIKRYIYNTCFKSKTGYQILQYISGNIEQIKRSILAIRIYIKHKIKNKGNTNFLPKSIMFEPTNICTAKCIFCAYRKINDQKYIMDIDTFKKGIQEFIDIGGQEIRLTPLVGEAFVDKGLFEKIQYTKDQGLKANLISNGTLLTVNENYKKIIDSGIDVFSISAGDIDYKVEAEIFGIQEDVAKNKITGIKKLIDYNKEKGGNTQIHISFRTYRNPSEMTKEDKFKNIFDQKPKRLTYDITTTYDNRGGLITKDDLLGEMKLRKEMFFKKAPCKNLYNAIGVLSNGDVRLCACRLRKSAFDELIVGNIRENNLKQILVSKKVYEIRNQFFDGKYPDVCKNCSFYQPFL